MLYLYLRQKHGIKVDLSPTFVSHFFRAHALIMAGTRCSLFCSVPSSAAVFRVTLLVVVCFEKQLTIFQFLKIEYEARGEHGHDSISKQATT